MNKALQLKHKVEKTLMNERKQPSQNTDHKLRMILEINQSYNPKKRMWLAVNVSLKQRETLMKKFIGILLVQGYI